MKPQPNFHAYSSCVNRGEGSILSALENVYVRESDNLPVAVTILFDKNEFEKICQFPPLQFKLGLGESLDNFGLASSVAPCSYSGSKAKAEFMAITGCSSDIPLEQNSVPSVDGFDFYDCLFWDP